MLRSLELFGFKSFADKTVFEFSSGITGVVGPNGSGKSNVVDSIKWILGDQSAKSLRGKEMTDVIFNGSSSRSGSQFAEATLVFDNKSRFLPVDVDEVSVGRRLWKSGDSEYLVNRNVARLKDVKELFMGTGAGASAYCIIEQGRVDQILQSNAANRRLIFEEAAGISRFKARRTEATRRLDRVEQNLLRLTDIVDEVESQVNAVRSQAQRAARFREVSTELEELWVGMVADDFRQHTIIRQKIEQQRDEASVTLTEMKEKQAVAEQQLQEADLALAEVDDELRAVEKRRSDFRSQIARLESTLHHQLAREKELLSELNRLQRQKTLMDSRVVEAEKEEEHLENLLLLEQERLQDRQQSRDSGHEQVQKLNESLSARQRSIENKRTQLLEQARQNSEIASQLGGLKSELQSLRTRRTELHSSREILEHEIGEIQQNVIRHKTQLDELLNNHAESSQLIEDKLATRDEFVAEHKRTTESLAALREHRSGALARKSVLEDLEDRQEGLGIGVRDILKRSRESGERPWNLIKGTVADLLDVDMDNAALLEVALSGRAQLLVIDQLQPLIDYLNSGRSRITGRVGFVSLEDAEAMPAADGDTASPAVGLHDPNTDKASTLDEIGDQPDWAGGMSLGMFGDDWLDSVLDDDLSNQIGPELKITWVDGDTGDAVSRSVFSSDGHELRSLAQAPGVVGRADRLARSPQQMPLLAAHLLADTWIVESLPDAQKLAREYGSGYRFVTLQGELLEKDGTLFTGIVRSETAVISRKSELRRLCNELHRTEHLISEQELCLKRLELDVQNANAGLKQARTSNEHSASRVTQSQQQLTDQENQLAGSREQADKLIQQLESVDNQIDGTSQQIQHTEARQAEGEREIARLQQEITDAEQNLLTDQQQIESLENQRSEANLELTRSEERLTGVRDALARLKEDLQQRHLQQKEATRRLQNGRSRIAELVLHVLNVRAEIAEIRIYDDELHDDIRRQGTKRNELKHRRQQATQEEQLARNICRQHETQFHELEIKIREINHQAETSAERIRDEFQVEVEDAVADNRSAVAIWLKKQAPQKMTDQSDTSSSSEVEHAEIPDHTGFNEDDGLTGALEAPSSDDADLSNHISSILNDEQQYSELRAQIEQRVDRLRRQLRKIGNVGMESLDNLNELESRFNRLHSQLQDLEAARDALRDMVRSINAESRRLFLESFETIRGHFRELFRRLFGGGEADVILEDPEDVLECAIDVVARPPGKELRSISLLSGGEKTMTAVALLLSIFKSRPSPFCILDEVDAALDDANIGRFVGVLKEFQLDTQFIMITHRKPTMAVTDVLYGVTMEESGISKRLSVRFEEIDEHGNFTPRDQSSHRAA